MDRQQERPDSESLSTDDHEYDYTEQYDYDHGYPPVNHYDFGTDCDHDDTWDHDYHNGVAHHHLNHIAVHDLDNGRINHLYIGACDDDECTWPMHTRDMSAEYGNGWLDALRSGRGARSDSAR